MRFKPLFFAIAALLGVGTANVTAAPAGAQLPDFMYQGKLDQNDNPANGNYDLTFSLWDAATGGNRIGDVISEPGYPVQHGLFSINLAFDGAFNGDQTWLEVSVNGSVLPRQAISTAPVAQFALSGNAGPAGPEGPQGPVGPIGAPGPQGPAGEAGATGPQGATGETGATGAQGPAGVEGVQGPIGETGPAGPVGATGATGETGPVGPAGATGATGAQGPIGNTGAQGVQGPIGPIGSQGATGATGAIGPQGPAGATGAVGAAGPAGPQGATGATGAQGPAGPAGSGKYRVTINGTLSTSLARPLHPVSPGGYGGNVSLISTQGYIVSIAPGGLVAGSTTASYASSDCSGPTLVFTNNFVHPGGIVGAGNTRALYYLPKTGATVVTNPTRNSRSTGSAVCEANVSALTGDYYIMPPNNPAVTGVDTIAMPVTVAIDYVP
jgi:hypothetical protein